MQTSPSLKRLSAVAAIAAAVLVPTLALTQDKPDLGEQAIEGRKGFMEIVVLEAGPLFGMAKGDVPYDAELAAANAANLNAIADYDLVRLFPEGTSNADRPDETRALPDIWADLPKFRKAMDDWRAAVAVVAAEAGKGQAELAAAVGEMGKACGGCHKPFRAEKE